MILIDPREFPLLAVMQDAVIMVDVRDRIVFFNSGAEQIFRCNGDDVLGQSLAALLPDAFQAPYLTYLHAFLNSNKTALGVDPDREVWARRQTGEVFPIEATVAKIKAGDETILILSLRDVSEQKRQQIALRRAHAALSAIIEASPLAIYTCDKDSNVLSWNSAAHRIFGWSEDEVLGKPLPTIPDAEQAAFEELMRDLLKGRSLAEAEMRRRTKDERVIDVSVSTAPLYDSAGVITGVMAITADISARKDAERKLRTLNRTLEQRVRERTAAAEERARELAKSNAELEQFAYVASHDLQEPLRMVASYTSLLGRRYQGRLDADADEFIAYAVNGATRMQQLINDLLVYSRLGRVGKPFEPIDCEVVFQHALDNLQMTVQKSDARIIRGPLPVVRGDASQLLQLFQNLMGNAIKFRRDEPPCIEVSASLDENNWHFVVKDNGIGIAPEYGERIFVIFQRLHARAEYPGTGMGLAICKKVVERHGGRIWVESTPGAGSRFHFTIPLSEPPVAASQSLEDTGGPGR